MAPRLPQSEPRPTSLGERDLMPQRRYRWVGSLFRNKLALLSVMFIALLVVVVLFGDALSPYPMAQQHLRYPLRGPIWSDAAQEGFLFGTDRLGRDILSRMIAGARVSLLVGFSSVVVGGIVGTALGLLAGYFRGFVEVVVMRLVDLQLAFPTMMIGMLVMALLGTGIVELVLVIALVQWAFYARIARAETLKIRELEYFVATESLGASAFRRVFRHVLPNIMSPLTVVASFSLSTAIFYESALSFFGVGIPPNIPTWGNMLADARDVMLITPWYPVFPGLAITFSVLAFNLLGDWLRDYTDVKIAD